MGERGLRAVSQPWPASCGALRSTRCLACRLEDESDAEQEQEEQAAVPQVRRGPS